MTDSEQRIEPVNDETRARLAKRSEQRRMQKLLRKAKDRRRNFERGEFAGFMYCMGLCAVVVANSGQLNNYALAWWQTAGIGLIGIIALIAKTYTKRRFWRETEDAEYQEEEDNDNS